MSTKDPVVRHARQVGSRFKPELRQAFLNRAWMPEDAAREADVSVWCIYRALQGRRITPRNVQKILLALSRTPALTEGLLEGAAS